ncbi:MAG: endo alpha-1,4 polygalactosaminidase [Solirubrobacteraceae bacterium]
MKVIAIIAVVIASLVSSTAALAQYRRPPATGDSWYWEIGPPEAGLAGLPATSGAYPSPGSATIWDTDLFEDSNTSSGGALRIPTGPSAVVSAIHAAGHYSVCYVEVGAYQTGYPDDASYLPADYGRRARRYEMQGYPNEWWLNIAGFRTYVAGEPSTLTGAAVNIAAVLGKRFAWCALEGQDAVEPDDLDGYTNRSATGAAGGGWRLTQADAAGFERWIAYQVHADHLAVLQKNDSANATVDEPLFDGVITEECNAYDDPCAGPGGDWDAYLAAGKPVLNAEYTQDGETTATFCSADDAWGIWGALFDVDLNGSTYQVCWNLDDEL